MLETWVLPKNFLVVDNLDLCIWNREEEIVFSDILTLCTEVLNSESKTNEVKPTLALECKLTTTLCTKFYKESLLVCEIRCCCCRKSCSLTCHIEISHCITDLILLSESLCEKHAVH